jgi:hypothetical protein
MSSKHAFGGLVVLMVVILGLPQTGGGTDWSVSPYRAQVANMQAGDQGGAHDSLAPGSPKKSIGKAVMFSLILPGTGQLYAQPWWRALPWMAIEVAGWAMFAHYHTAGQDKTDEFEKYAGWRDTPNNFNPRAYLFQEWWVAQDSTRTGRPQYNGNFDTWAGMVWTDDAEPVNARSTYLPAPFTHDVLTNDRQQYFEEIGKYLWQFGWGWRDTYSFGNGGDVADTSVWANPAPGLTRDDPSTLQFDGDSPMFFHYAAMRGEANDLLNNGNIAMEVVLANHVLSAFEAAFLVRSHNKHLSKEPVLGDLKLHYDARRVDGNMTRSLTVGIPLNLRP